MDELQEIKELLDKNGEGKEAPAKKRRTSRKVATTIEDSNNVNKIGDTCYYREEIPVKVMRMFDDVELPIYKHEGDACADVRAYRLIEVRNEMNIEVRNEDLEKGIFLHRGWSIKIGTGLRFQIPRGWAINMEGRSGFSIKEATVIPNAPAKVDSNYTGELIIGLVNLNAKPTRIEKGDRIAQIEIVPQYKMVFEEVSEIEENKDRGSSGIGDSGMK